MAVLRTEADQKTQEIAELQASQRLDEKQRQELVQQAGDLANKLQTRLQAERFKDHESALRSSPPKVKKRQRRLQHDA